MIIKPFTLEHILSQDWGSMNLLPFAAVILGFIVVFGLVTFLVFYKKSKKDPNLVELSSKDFVRLACRHDMENGRKQAALFLLEAIERSKDENEKSRLSNIYNEYLKGKETLQRLFKLYPKLSKRKGFFSFGEEQEKIPVLNEKVEQGEKVFESMRDKLLQDSVKQAEESQNEMNELEKLTEVIENKGLSSGFESFAKEIRSQQATGQVIANFSPRSVFVSFAVQEGTGLRFKNIIHPLTKDYTTREGISELKNQISQAVSGRDWVLLSILPLKD